MNEASEPLPPAIETWEELSETWSEEATARDRLRDVIRAVDEHRNDAKKERDRAVDSDSPDGFRLAGESFEKALTLLGRAQEELSYNLSNEDRLELAKATAHCHGSAGGTHRDAEEWDKAIAAYDTGLQIQTDLGMADTYTELQRLLVRVLKEPRCLEAGDPKTVEDVNVRKELRVIRNRLEKPMRDVNKDADDKVWEMADIAQLRVLLGQPQAKAWREFAAKNRSRDAYEVNYRIYRALEKAGVTLQGVLDSKTWLAERLGTLYQFQPGP